MKIETLEKIWIVEFVALRSKCYAFKCGDDSTNKLKGNSKCQSKHNKIEEYYNCLFGGKYQKESNNYILKSINHDMYLQEIKKSTLSFFDDKRCFINETKSQPWDKKKYSV